MSASQTSDVTLTSQTSDVSSIVENDLLLGDAILTEGVNLDPISISIENNDSLEENDFSQTFNPQ